MCGVAIIEAWRGAARRGVGRLPSGVTICDIKTTIYTRHEACRVKRNSSVTKALLHQRGTGRDAGYRDEKERKRHDIIPDVDLCLDKYTRQSKAK